MKNSTKIIIVLIVLAIGGYAYYNSKEDSDAPKIEVTTIDTIAKSIAFKMSYKAAKFATTVKLGGLRKQVIGDYTFEAITKGQTIVLSIKDKANKVLTTKTIDFA